MEKLVKYMLDVALGMHFLSEKGLVHRVSDHRISNTEHACSSQLRTGSTSMQGT